MLLLARMKGAMKKGKMTLPPRWITMTSMSQLFLLLLLHGPFLPLLVLTSFFDAALRADRSILVNTSLVKSSSSSALPQTTCPSMMHMSTSFSHCLNFPMTCISFHWCKCLAKNAVHQFSQGHSLWTLGVCMHQHDVSGTYTHNYHFLCFPNH